MELSNQHKQRFAEIDLLRGLSIVAMVTYHTVWDLWYFNLVDLNITSTKSQLIAATIGSSFLVIVGICLYLSTHRIQNSSELWQKCLKRGIKVLAWAFIITLVTHVALDAAVLFGILHLIAVSIMLAPLFVSKPASAGIVGILMIISSRWLTGLPINSNLLLPFGIGRPSMTMPDYYPLFPWFGVVLLGIWLGSLLYSKGHRRFSALQLKPITNNSGAKFMQFLGRHSLFIYIIHQPIVFGVTYLIAYL